MARQASEKRVPLNGSVELTRRCNLRCRHCYQATARESNSAPRELSTAEWCGVIDQVAEAGCLFLLVTGGEPLLRHDFDEIYRHARRSGLLVTVFTNGTMVGDDTVELFREWPPHEIEISLYGATGATCERITGVPGSFERCRRGIDRLLAAGLPVRLKTILMTENAHEFDQIETLARELGVKFRFDAAIFPTLDGDPAPLGLRVPAREAVAREFADPARRQGWLDFYLKSRDFPAFEQVYNCVAGQTTYHIDPHGYLQPCLLLPEPRHSLVSGSFADGWARVLPALRQRKAGAGNACVRCEKRALCGLCPAIFTLETGAAETRSQYLCELGEHRWAHIQHHLEKDTPHVSD